MAQHYNVILRIPELAADPPSHRAIMYWVVNPQSPCVLSPLDGADTWAFGMSLPPGVDKISDVEVVRRLHAAIGRPVDVEFLERDLWAAHRLIADRYRDRRAFLAGDACRLDPPFGGYGMNRVSPTASIWVGSSELFSPDGPARRCSRPTKANAGRCISGRSRRRSKTISILSDQLLRRKISTPIQPRERRRVPRSSARSSSKTREFKTLGVVLGSRYENSPIVIADGSTAPIEHHANYQPSAHPGCLAPHAWLDDGSSLYDHFGPAFSLLLLENSGANLAQELAAAANAAGMPLRISRSATYNAGRNLSQRRSR